MTPEEKLQGEMWVKKKKQELGLQMEQMRKEIGLGRFHFSEQGMHKAQVKNIEESRSNYTIEVLLTYLYHAGLDIEVKRRER